MWMAQVPAALALRSAMAVRATASVSAAVRTALALRAAMAVQATASVSAAALVVAMAASGESGSGGPWWRGIGAGPASDCRPA